MRKKNWCATSKMMRARREQSTLKWLIWTPRASTFLSISRGPESLQTRRSPNYSTRNLHSDLTGRQNLRILESARGAKPVKNSWRILLARRRDSWVALRSWNYQPMSLQIGRGTPPSSRNWSLRIHETTQLVSSHSPSHRMVESAAL